MQDSRKSKAQLIDELAALRQRVAELEHQPRLALDRSTPAPDSGAEPLNFGEPYFRSVLAALPEAIVITGMFGQITFANEQAARLHGFATPGDMLAESVYDLIAPAQRTKVIEMVRQAVLSRAIHHIETELIRQDGTTFWAELTATSLYDAQGSPTAVVGIVRDVTTRKELAEALQASEAQFRAVVEDQTELICRFQPDGVLTFVNDTYCRAFGKTREELIGDNFMPVIPEEDQALIAREMAKLTPQLPVVTYEHRVILSNGDVRWQQWTDRALYDPAGELIEYQSVGRDVTARRQIEQELMDTKAMLEAAITQSPVPMALLRAPDGLQQIVNPALREYLGIQAESSWTDLTLDHLERSWVNLDRQGVPVPTDQSPAVLALRGIGTYNLEGGVRRKDGTLRSDLTSAVPIFNSHGQQVAAFVVIIDITDRKQLEEALHASEERYRTLIENQGEGMGLVDANEFFVFANPAAEDLFGLPGKLVGRNLDEFVDEEQYALLKHETLLRQQGVKSTYELTVHRPDGQVRNLIITATPQFDAMGWFMGTFGVFRDITARKQVEAEVRRLNAELEQRVIERTMELAALNTALQDDIHHRQRIEDMLRRSEQRYRTLFESAADAIFIFNLSGQFIEANRVAGERYGYSLDELRQMNVMNLAPAGQQEFIPARLEQTRHQGFNRFETVHQRRDGTLIPVDVNSRVIEYGGQPAILSIIRDITDRKRTEQTLRRYNTEQAALYDTALLLNAQLDVAALLRLIVEQAAALLGVSAGGVCLYDEGRDTLVLAVGLDLYAKHVGVEIKPGEGLAGQAFQQRAVLMPEDYQTWSGQSPADEQDGYLRAVIAAPLLAKQVPLGVLFVASDQHKQRFDDHDRQLVELFAAQAATALENARLYARQQEQYRRLQEAQARLIHAEKMSALGQLIASISHEINNPLQAVQGCLTLVREGMAEATVQPDRTMTTNWQRDLSVAATEVQRIANIVQRLRDFYRPARAGLQVVDVAAAIDTVLALAAKQLQHCGITVERSATATPPLTVTTNADQLKQILLNLVLNAIDAMPNGGRLQVVATPDTLPRPTGTQPAVRIDLTDTGHGMTPDTVTRIFEPFFTTKESGSGLGLAISYELVTSLGGEINVTSEVGVGTTFSIQLPVSAGDDIAEVTA